MAYDTINSIIGKLDSGTCYFVGRMRLAPYAQRGPRHDFVFMRNRNYRHTEYAFLIVRVTSPDDIIAIDDDPGHWSLAGLFNSNYLSETYVTK